jgi:stage IV sporulation protein FB
MGLNDRGYKFDRDDRSTGGGIRRAFRRIFVEGDNPLTWSFPLFRAFRIDVRVHFVFVLFVLIEVFLAAGPNRMGPGLTLAGLAVLFTLVLLHEFGHCFACRYVRGEADSILLWPLGGLANCSPPHEWKANLITTLGGPAVNVLLFPVFSLALLAAGASTSVVFAFNPFNPGSALGDLWFQSSSTAVSYAKYFLWWAHYMNVALLAFNMLLPMYPMDAARTLQALLWKRLGYRRATQITINTGIFFAVVVAVFALATGQGILLGLAVFAGITCYLERKRLEMTSPEFDVGGPSGGYPSARHSPEDRAEARRFAAAAKRQETERLEREAEQREVDRILAKINAEGLASLSKREKETLARATERQRSGR